MVFIYKCITKFNIVLPFVFIFFIKTVSTSTVVSWESEATPSATPFFKRAYKISHPPRLWVSWIDLPSFASSSKIWHNFSNKVFFSWSYEKVILTKNVRLTYYSSMKKKFRKIWMIFDIENSLWKSIFFTLGQAGKATLLYEMPSNYKGKNFVSKIYCYCPQNTM